MSSLSKVNKGISIDTKTLLFTMDIKHVQFKHPFTGVISGPTGSGKTVLMRQILSFHKELFHYLPSDPKILWSYGQWQEGYKTPIPNIQVDYFEGLPSHKELEEIMPDLIIIDDLMAEMSGDLRLANLFTKGSHHLN